MFLDLEVHSLFLDAFDVGITCAPAIWVIVITPRLLIREAPVYKAVVFICRVHKPISNACGLSHDSAVFRFDYVSCLDLSGQLVACGFVLEY